MINIPHPSEGRWKTKASISKRKYIEIANITLRDLRVILGDGKPLAGYG